MVKKIMSWMAATMLLGALAACGGGGEQSAPAVEPTGNVVELTIQATNFEFNEKEFRVKAGDTVNLTFESTQGMHGIDIRGMNMKMSDGDKKSFVAAPGEYDIICNIMCGSGHSQMKAKLIVE